MVSRPEPTRIRSKKAVRGFFPFFFLVRIFPQGLRTILTALMRVQALSISCSYCLTDGSRTDLPFCVCQCPINSIWEPSNSKQILLHILCIKSSETEQKVLLKCHIQLLHLVHFLIAYFHVLLGLMTRAMRTSPKFSTNSSYLHGIGTWTSSSWTWICVSDPSHLRYVPSHPLAGKSCAHKANMFGHYFSEDMKFCSQLCCTGVTLHMLLVPSSLTCTLPYSFWIHWPLSVTVDKMEQISKIRSS